MKKLPETLTEDEFLQVLKVTKKHHHKVAFMLGFYQGMRISEVVKLQVKDIDKNQKLIRIKEAKGKKDRNIPIMPEMFRHFKEIPMKCGVRALEYAFKNSLRKAKIKEHLYFHSLRHSSATWLLNIKKWDIRYVQIFLGHSRLDSVPDYTPIMIKTKGQIDILSIEDLWLNYYTTEPIYNIPTPKEEIFIFNRVPNSKKGKYWSRINDIFRHEYSGNLIRLNCSGGIIDTSPNHSIIGKDGRKTLDAKQIKKGDLICISNEKNISWKWGFRDSEIFPYIGTLDLSWLYGFFSAEGSVVDRRVYFYNFNKDLLLKCKKILQDNFHVRVRISYGKSPRVDVFDRRIAKFFKENFYTSQKLKRVPQFILNAANNIKKAFLEGYNIGDGYSKNQIGFKSFTSNSQVLMAGLIYLIRCADNLDYNLFCRKDKPTITQAQFCKEGTKKTNHREVKKIMKINYKGFLYDLSTEDETFCAGVGNIKVHNTTQIYTHVSPQNLIDLAWKK